jgi:hypothetical protein
MLVLSILTIPLFWKRLHDQSNSRADIATMILIAVGVVAADVWAFILVRRAKRRERRRM